VVPTAMHNHLTISFDYFVKPFGLVCLICESPDQSLN